MATIHMERKHALGIEAAHSAVEDIARQIKASLQIEYRWDGDILRFERPGATGTIAVTATTVTVDVELGVMLSAFSGMVEQQMANYLNQYFG